MDRPVPEGVTIHKVDFDLMGVRVTIPSYKENDWIQYGGMIYKPENQVSGVQLSYSSGCYSGIQRVMMYNAPSDPSFYANYYTGEDGRTWGSTGYPGRLWHLAEMWGHPKAGWSFYCS